jgi:membrane associated rhomboid family serine protease
MCEDEQIVLAEPSTPEETVDQPAPEDLEPSSRPGFPWLTLLTCVTCIAATGVLQCRERGIQQGLPGILAPHTAHGIWSGAYWALLTSVFLHAGFWHFLFNVYWMWVLGKSTTVGSRDR